MTKKAYTEEELYIRKQKWNAYMREYRGAEIRGRYKVPYNYTVLYKDSKIIKYEVKGKCVTIDISDIPLFESKRWHWQRAQQRKMVYYLFTRVGKGKESLHRLIINAQNGQLVDHINRDTSDCTRKNLRIATPSENNLNSSVRVNKKGGTPKGVMLKIKNGRYYYYSSITIFGKTNWIGSFNNPEDASAAFEVKAKERELLYRKNNLIK